MKDNLVDMEVGRELRRKIPNFVVKDYYGFAFFTFL